MGQTVSPRIKNLLLKILTAPFFFCGHGWGKPTEVDSAVASTPLAGMLADHSGKDYRFLLEDVWRVLSTVLTETNWLNVLHVAGRITVILTISYFFMRLIDKIVRTLIPKINASRTIHSHSPLIKTILPIMRSILRWVLGLMTLLLLFSELGVNITPLVYSLSVIGLAVTMGSQNLVKDFLNGVTILVEGSITVGDEVIIGSYKGVVESMSLRYVHIRHDMGALHTIPFSEVGTITNVSRDYVKVIFSLICEPSVSLEVLERSFKEVYQELKLTDEWQAALSSPIEFQGIKRVTAQGLEVVAQLKTTHAYSKALTYAFYNKLMPLCQEREVPLVFGVSDSDTHTNQYVVY